MRDCIVHDFDHNRVCRGCGIPLRIWKMIELGLDRKSCISTAGAIGIDEKPIGTRGAMNMLDDLSQPVDES